MPNGDRKARVKPAMSKGKEFFEYCVANPDVLTKLRGLKNDEIAAYLKSHDFEMSDSDIRDFTEMCAESNDAVLAAAASGGNCTGHCGVSCEDDDYPPP